MFSLISILLLFSVPLFMPTSFKVNHCKASGSFFTLVLSFFSLQLIFFNRDVDANPGSKLYSWGNFSICQWVYLRLLIYEKLHLLKEQVNFYKFAIINLSDAYFSVNVNNLELTFSQDLIIYPILSKEVRLSMKKLSSIKSYQIVYTLKLKQATKIVISMLFIGHHYHCQYNFELF